MPSSGARVTAQGPFAVGSVIWRDAHGRLICTVVAKATYALVPGESAPLLDPLPLQERDGHWDDDPTKSLSLPSDLAPFKQAAEIVIIGSAFAPSERPVAHVAARVVVGSIDKGVDVWRPRRFRPDGNIEESPLQSRFSLRYEHAAGGAGSDNPVGVDVERPDGRGKYLIPSLLPPTFTVARRGEFVPSIGLGPLAPSWPPRAAGLLPPHAAWLNDPAGSPLPPGFFAKYFQVAPADQRLDRALAANERLVLEGLHREIPRLVTNLSGLEPRAIVVGSSDEPRRLQGDLLVVNTDRARATLTYRAQIPLDEAHGELRVIVVGAPMGFLLGEGAVREIVAAEDERKLLNVLEDEAASTLAAPPRSVAPGPRASAPVRPARGVEVDALTTSQGTLPQVIRSAALPFSAPAAPAIPPRTSLADGVLPFRGAPLSSPPPPLSVPAPPPISSPPPAPIAPAMHAPALAPSWRAQETSAPFVVPEAPAAIVDVAPRSVAREASPRAFTPRSEPATAPTSSAFGGVKAASDAAAGRENARDGASPFASRDAAKGPLRRLAVIDLLSFDPKIAARLRAMKRFAPILAPPSRAGGLQGVDAPRADVPDRDRADVLRVLSFGSPVSAAEVRSALADCLDDLADLDPPFALVAGELRPVFDEVETLRSAVAIARPVAGGDKKLLTTLAIAEEALASPVLPRSDTALGLSRQIEQASSSLSLPPRYVASEVERALLEGRKYKRRTLLGAARVRADLIVGREGAVFPLYLLDAVASSLPLLPSYPVSALCEVRPREDLAESAPESLFAVALGRILHFRSEG